MEASVRAGQAPGWAHSLDRDDRVALLALQRARVEESNEAHEEAERKRQAAKAAETRAQLAAGGIDVPAGSPLLNMIKVS
jgi:hypothetical protein